MENNKEFRKEMRDTLSDLKDAVGGLKVKAAIAGGIAGIVGTGIITAVFSAIKFK